MTERIKKLYEIFKSKEYRKQRKKLPENLNQYINYSKEDEVVGFEKYLEAETPVFYGDDQMGFYRSFNGVVDLFCGNVTADFGKVITLGFDKLCFEISEQKPQNAEEKQFLEGMMRSVIASQKFAERYRIDAEKKGYDKLSKILERVPSNGATSFAEACVFLKFCLYMLRYSHANHVTLGRFDQYMYPFYIADLKRGVSKDELFETLEEFFISINIDTDTYFGLQQGDNGQSMVLGGFDIDGNSMYNELSELCINASRELKLIDPKINLRVGKNTPDEIYEFATLLTKEGLGFPQYCNDDIVVPGLVKLGYSREDAVNYTVAACWEYIIPGKGADTPNLISMDFPHVTEDSIEKNILNCETFSELLEKVKDSIKTECDRLIRSKKLYTMPDMPLLSAMMDGPIKEHKGLFRGGCKYNNYGCHGVGISVASDSLAAIKKNVYDDKTITKQELLTALKANFVGTPELLNKLRNSPKMGNNVDYVDDLAFEIMDAFAKSMNNRKNNVGGIYRAGTGSAMDYLSLGEKCPATADGRKEGEAYASSFSPSLNARTDGLLSVIQSFTKFDLTNIINGGPLTIEIHDTVFRNEMGIKKTAQLIKNYILLGGHQLQINSINRETLLDAQKHPEEHQNLIVRVWGWSGYFNELDLNYQNHIIQRTEYSCF